MDRYDHLRAVNDVLYSILKAKYMTKWLMDNDQKSVKFFTKAVTLTESQGFQSAFMNTFIYWDTADLLILFNRLKELTCDNFQHRLRNRKMPDGIDYSNINFGVYFISEDFDSNGKTLTLFDQPEAKYN